MDTQQKKEAIIRALKAEALEMASECKHSHGFAFGYITEITAYLLASLTSQNKEEREAAKQQIRAMIKLDQEKQHSQAMSVELWEHHNRNEP